MVPAVATAHYKGFAIPAEQDDVTIIQIEGGRNQRASYSPDIGAADVIVTIQGSAWKTYTGYAQQYPSRQTTFIVK